MTAAVSIAADPVEAWARTHGVTVSCVIFGCWALLLHVRTGTERPVFGATFSGRSVDVERFGAVVGMFANTVPLQVAVEPALPVPVWFRRVFAHQQEAQQFEHAPLGRTLSWAGISSRPPLFDSLIVHTNYPHHDLGGEQPAGAEWDIRLTEFRGAVTSTFPVTLVVKPEQELILELLYAPARLTCGAADRILHEFRSLVERVVSAGRATVADVLPTLGAEPHVPVQATPAGLPDRLREVANEHPCEPAGDAVEAQLMRIFDDLIDVRQIGRDDNFFELGGDSLLVPLLIDRIEGDFGVTLPLGVIFEAPTVRALAAAVTAGNPNSSWQSLVAIREHGCRPPLYLVHGLGGEIDHFYNLVRYLHPEQPVYALQPPPAEQTALEQIAEHYVREIPPKPAVRSLSTWRLLYRWVYRVRDGAPAYRGRRARAAADDHRLGQSGDTAAPAGPAVARDPCAPIGVQPARRGARKGEAPGRAGGLPARRRAAATGRSGRAAR